MTLILSLISLSPSKGIAQTFGTDDIGVIQAADASLRQNIGITLFRGVSISTSEGVG